MTITTCVAMNLKRVLAVLQVVRDGDAFGWKLFWFANGDKTSAEVISERGCEDKSTRFDSDHRIDLLPFEFRCECVYSISQAFWMFQQRCNVVEVDAGFGKVRDFADEFF